MIRIVSSPLRDYRGTTTCTRCSTVFEFEAEDVSVREVLGDRFTSIECPTCDLVESIYVPNEIVSILLRTRNAAR